MMIWEDGLTLFLGVANILALMGLLWAMFVRSRARSETRAAMRARDRMRDFINAAPDAYAGWTQDGHFRTSPRLDRWLGLTIDPPTDFGALTGLGFSSIAEQVGALLKNGEPFREQITLAGGRTVEVTGATVSADPESPFAQVLWLHDITDFKLRLSQADAARQTAERDSDSQRAVLDQAPFPVWRRGRDLRLAWVNQAYARAVEAPDPTTAVENNIELVSPAGGKSAAVQAAEARLKGLPTRQNHYAVIEGQRQALDIWDVPLQGADGDVAGFAIDVTALDEARADLAEHIESHNDLLNKLTTAVAIFDADKSLRFFNNAFAELWHLSEQWLETRPHHSELLEAMRENRRLPEQANFPAWKRDQLAVYTQLIEPREEMWHLPDGSTLRVVTQPHPFGGLLVLYEDVTDRLALERSYNTLIDVQRETLNNIHEALAVFGGDGLLKLHNPAFAKLWLLDDEFLAGEPHVLELIEHCRRMVSSVSDWDPVRRAILGEGVERKATNRRLNRPDGMIVDHAIVPLPDGATLLTYMDVTDNIRIERALRERNEALLTADRLKSEFIANISYELRTPLNTIIGFSEILAQEYFGALNQRQKEYSRGILDSSQKLLALINDILDLATFEAGAMVLEESDIAVRDLLASVIEVTGEQARKKWIDISLDCAADLGPLRGDEKRLRQVIFNLMSNAIKFTPPGGAIQVSALPRGDQIDISVRDNGIGIAPDEQDNVFEKFRVGVNSPNHQGAGLGLSIVRSFVELHGGSVSLNSAIDQGTTVTCHLPRTR